MAKYLDASIEILTGLFENDWELFRRFRDTGDTTIQTTAHEGLNDDQMLEALSQRVGNMEATQQTTLTKIDTVESRVNDRISVMDTSVRRVEIRVDSSLSALDASVRENHEALSQILDWEDAQDLGDSSLI